VIILSFIAEQSQDFVRELKENKNKGNKEAFYIKCFKFPFATYLTADLFEGLKKLITNLSKKLVKSQKTEANTADQYSF
jgi:hypothetical protein